MGHRVMRLVGALVLVVAASGFVAAARAQGYSPTGTCPAHQWNYAYGSMTTAADCLQPSFGDLSGTFSASQLPLATTSAVGVVEIGGGLSVNGSGVVQLGVGSANTVKGSVNGTGETDLSVPSCSSASNALQWTSGGGFSCATLTSSTSFVPPQGRLTLTSHTPVLTTGVTGTSTLYYDAYRGNTVPVYNGTTDVLLTIGSNEISDALPSSGTGDVLSGNVFDEWAVNVSGTLTLCHATNGSGGGWASDTSGSNTARGTGYTQLDNHTRSYLTNKNSIADCYNGSTNEGSITTNEATYLGSFYTTANGQTGVSFGGSASGGTAGLVGLWNYYNRRRFTARVIDSGATYTYSGSVRQARGSTSDEVQIVAGVQEDSIGVKYTASALVSAAAYYYGIGLDSTSTFVGNSDWLNSGSSTIGTSATNALDLNPSAGFHTISANEDSNATSSTLNNLNANELDVTMLY
jgi:hypothetical protein